MKPVIFQKFMKWFPREYRPNIVIAFDLELLYKINRKVRGKPIHTVEFYNHFFFDNGIQGYNCFFDGDTTELLIAVIDEKGDPVREIRTKVDDKQEFDKIVEWDRVVVHQVMFVLFLITEAREKRTSVFTAQRNKASVYYKEGDAVKFKRIFDMKRLPSPDYEAPEPGASGIKKKQHDVIGHWRRYKNGAKVYVKPHKRGNPELGIVRSLFT